jgi:predicted dehydrogenase
VETDTRTALVGFGYWGANVARNLSAARGIELVGVADADADRRQAAAAQFPGLSTWVDLAAVLDDPKVEAVVLATPAATHGPMALQVLASGRHVLVEKPLALEVDQAQDVAELAGETGLVAMVGHTFLYSAPVIKLREYVESGQLGAVQYLYSQRLSLGRIRTDCNALWNFAPHDVSIMLYVLDERPVEVSARGFSFIQAGIEDVFFASLTFESGIGANLHVSWIDPRKTRLLTVVGDDKMAVYDDVSPDRKIHLFDAGVARSGNPSLGEYSSLGDFQWRTRAGDIVIPRISLVEPLLVEMEAFATACQTGDRPRADARRGVDVIRTLTAIDHSAKQGGTPVEVAR